MNLGGGVEGPAGGAAVNLTSVDLADLHFFSGLGGVIAKVYKGLGAVGLPVVSWGVVPGPVNGRAVILEVIVTGGDQAHVPVAVVVDPIAVIVLIGGIRTGNDHGLDVGAAACPGPFDGGGAALAAHGVAGHAQPFGIHIGQLGEHLQSIVGIYEVVPDLGGIAMAVHIHGNDYHAAAGQLHGGGGLAFLGLPPAVDNHNAGGGVLLGSAVGLIQQGAEGQARVGFRFDFGNGDFAEVCHQKVGKDHADQHHGDGDGQQTFGMVLKPGFHFVLLSFC